MGAPVWEISSAGRSPRRLTGVAAGRVRSSQGTGAPAQGGPGTSGAAVAAAASLARGLALVGLHSPTSSPTQQKCKPITMSEQLKKIQIKFFSKSGQWSCDAGWDTAMRAGWPFPAAFQA